MALLIKIIKDPAGTPTTFFLKAESIGNNTNRPLIASPLPGGSRIIMDLGMSSKVITISGTCNAENDATNIATKEDIEAMDSWWDFTIHLYESATRYHVGKIKSLDLKRKAEADYYEWRIDFECESTV